ncbi:MAG TPA: TonB-dependent receptor, partial [Anditalea sp.]|nr:TonB-dependent receptor [Anditalea sp.]
MKTVITILFFFSITLSSAQESRDCSYVIRGKVVHAEHQEPIEGATIYIHELKTGVLSDIRGNFRITNLCTDTRYTFTIQYLGHTTLTEEVNVSGNTSLTFRLIEEDIVIEGVDVHGHRDAVITTSTVSSLSGRALQETRGATLGESLKRISGITTYSTGSNVSKPVIHGLHSNRIMILNNGVRQEGQQWGTEHAPEIDPFMAEEIAVVKGAETVRYGPEAMGGVILVNPAKLPTSKTLKGEVFLIGASNGQMGNTSLNISGGSGKFKGLGYRIQSSGKIAGNIHSPDYYQANTGVRELNFSGEVGYNTRKLSAEIYYSRFQTILGILSDAHTGNLSDLNEIINNGRPFRDPDFTYRVNSPRQEVLHNLLKAKLHYHYDNGNNLDIKYGFQKNQRQEFDRRRGELNERPSLDLELFTNTLEVSYEHYTRKNWNGSVGISFIQQANSNIPGTGVTPLIPNYDMGNVGVFAMEKFTSGPLEIEAGLRYDYRKVSASRFIQRNEIQERDFIFNNFSAFLGAHYSFSPTVSFNTNLGSAWRPPNINEQFSQGLHHGTAAIEIGNPDFISEQALKWVNTLTITENRFS